MPLLGAGIIPSGPIGTELETTIRRVFAQMVVLLIYRQNPLLALLLRNAIRASGGVSPYTQPVQTGKYVNSSWMGPAGQFAIAPEVAATVNAEFNLCALATPVSSFGLEQLGVPREEMQQRLTEALALVGLAGFSARDPGTLSATRSGAVTGSAWCFFKISRVERPANGGRPATMKYRVHPSE